MSNAGVPLLQNGTEITRLAQDAKPGDRLALPGTSRGIKTQGEKERAGALPQRFAVHTLHKTASLKDLRFNVKQRKISV